MKNMEWQDKAIGSKRVLLRAARRAGKSTIAIKWARERGGHILFTTPYETMAKDIAREIGTLYEDEIETISKYPLRISFKDGAVMHIVSKPELDSLRGMRIDAVVLDEAGYMSEDQVIAALATVAERADFSFFASYSGDSNTAVKRIKKLGEVSPVEFITVDYLDLLEGGLYTAAGVRAVKSTMTSKAFAEEMGPYDEEQKTVRGASFLSTFA